MKTLLLALLSLVPAFSQASELQTVPYVDLNRYLGKWYEIASIPASFSKDCFNSTATYSLLPDGDIKVVNACETEKGPKSVEGKAWVVDEKTNAKLKVRFFWPFTGNYWVIDLGRNYEYAVVGEPSRDYLWVLSRNPRMSNAELQQILKRAAAKEYDIRRVVRTRN